MTDTEILAGIADEGQKHLQWEGPLDPGLRLAEDLELDSIKLLTLAIAVENRFQIRLNPELDHELETIQDLVNAIRRLAS